MTLQAIDKVCDMVTRKMRKVKEKAIVKGKWEGSAGPRISIYDVGPNKQPVSRPPPAQRLRNPSCLSIDVSGSKHSQLMRCRRRRVSPLTEIRPLTTNMLTSASLRLHTPRTSCAPSP